MEVLKDWMGGNSIKYKVIINFILHAYYTVVLVSDSFLITNTACLQQVGLLPSRSGKNSLSATASHNAILNLLNLLQLGCIIHDYSC